MAAGFVADMINGSILFESVEPAADLKNFPMRCITGCIAVTMGTMPTAWRAGSASCTLSGAALS